MRSCERMVELALGELEAGKLATYSLIERKLVRISCIKPVCSSLKCFCFRCILPWYLAMGAVKPKLAKMTITLTRALHSKRW